MTRKLSVMAIVAVCAASAPAAMLAADLSGTWLGVTQVPNIGEDRIKLELKAEGASYTGLVTDSAGIIVPSPITNVKVDGATLTFDIAVDTGDGPFAVHITLKADGDTLTGSWALDSGESAPMNFAREKK